MPAKVRFRFFFCCYSQTKLGVVGAVRQWSLFHLKRNCRIRTGKSECDGVCVCVRCNLYHRDKAKRKEKLSILRVFVSPITCRSGCRNRCLHWLCCRHCHHCPLNISKKASHFNRPTHSTICGSAVSLAVLWLNARTRFAVGIKWEQAGGGGTTQQSSNEVVWVSLFY